MGPWVLPASEQQGTRISHTGIASSQTGVIIPQLCGMHQPEWQGLQSSLMAGYPRPTVHGYEKSLTRQRPPTPVIYHFEISCIYSKVWAYYKTKMTYQAAMCCSIHICALIAGGVSMLRNTEIYRCTSRPMLWLLIKRMKDTYLSCWQDGLLQIFERVSEEASASALTNMESLSDHMSACRASSATRTEEDPGLPYVKPCPADPSIKNIDSRQTHLVFLHKTT